MRIGYARASTIRQSLDTQTDSLRAAGVTRISPDARDVRPLLALAAALADLRRLDEAEEILNAADSQTLHGIPAQAGLSIPRARLHLAAGRRRARAGRTRGPIGPYKWYRSRGLLVGSGAVEAGCKSVIGQHLKLSGMHWTIAGAGAIAMLRCQQASRPEDQIWPAVRNQTPAA